jgi:hypothetical protein
MTTRRVAISIAALALAPLFAQAQVRKVPGTSIGNQVVVQVYLVLADSTHFLPLAHHDLEIVGETNVMRVTDDAGGTTALVSTGPHQAVTLDPVWWHGRRLTWKVPFDAHAGMATVLLTERNATVVEPSRAVIASGDVGPVPRPRVTTSANLSTPVATRVHRGDRVYIGIDGAVWEVFEQELGGPAPQPGGRSPDSLRALMFTAEHQTRQLDAFPRDWRRFSDAEIADLFGKARVIEP